ncbi:uncharacterized protein PAC_03941 [Phialocephala subalpina]|uniref:Uncharacterized protein n=1 Tax=Phialocephala subalpina TaxID=576137 RepID=A0A1L7WMT6_9HELO|nr:uncharacterized protein PAC_03941 [Phialocephala subalpina]
MESRCSIHRESTCTCSDFVSSEIISSYKTHIHGLEALVKLFEELLRRAETAECELINVSKECESKSIEVTTILATLTKIKIDLEKCRRERDEACSIVEQIRREKIRIVEEFERERIEFREKIEKDSREIIRLQEEFKKVEIERDMVCVERDRFRRDNERMREEFDIERLEFIEKETRITNEVRKWRESFECCEEERKIVIISLEEVREEKEKILIEFEAERIEFRERESRNCEEIRIWKEKFECCEKERDTIRIDLTETCTILEKEREKSCSSEKIIRELKEQYEIVKRSLRTANESEEKAHEEAELARKEFRKADHERDEFQAKFFEAQETIIKIREEEKSEREEEVTKELIKCKADLARCTEHLETFLPPVHLRGQKFCIDKVMYCGKLVENPKVLKEIHEAANGGKPFKPTDKSCGGESWPKNSKTFTVAYMVDGKGPLKHISVPEGNNVRFH